MAVWARSSAVSRLGGGTEPTNPMDSEELVLSLWTRGAPVVLADKGAPAAQALAFGGSGAPAGGRFGVSAARPSTRLPDDQIAAPAPARRAWAKGPRRSGLEEARPSFVQVLELRGRASRRGAICLLLP